MRTLLAVAVGLAMAAPSAAQAVSSSERDALVQMRVDRGGRPNEMDALIQVANDAGSKGLPVAPLTNKIREGLAKNHDLKRIEVVVRQMVMNLEAADGLVREVQPGVTGAARSASVTLLAEALGGGVTADEVRGVGRAAAAGGTSISSEEIASAGKALSLMKGAGLAAGDANAVVVEAVRRRFRPEEMLELGREVKRREADYRAGRASARALRDAIARGDRPDRLFPGSRPTTDRPAATIPSRPSDRPPRPEVPQRPEPPARPDRPARL
jgi:uncharacterized tellurite resistance protein B-like protein